MIPMLKGSLNTEKGSIWTRHSEKCNTSWLKSEKGSIWTPHSEKCNTSWLKSEKGSIWTPQSHFSNTLSLKKAKLRKQKTEEVAHEHQLWKPSIWTPQSQKCNTSEIDSEHTEHPEGWTSNSLITSDRIWSSSGQPLDTLITDSSRQLATLIIGSDQPLITSGSLLIALWSTCDHALIAAGLRLVLPHHLYPSLIFYM